MKKLLPLFLCVLFIAALPTAALADVIWEPMDDFYFEHYDECSLTEFEYTADASVTVYSSPEDRTVVDRLAQGETREILVVWTAKTGDEWGYFEYYEDGWVNGWINLSRSNVAPSGPLVSLPIVLTVCVLAAAAIAILFIKPKKR